MIDRVKKHKLIYTVAWAASFALAVIFTGVVFMLVLNETYPPMWFFLAFSCALYIATPFLLFAAIDRKTVLRMIAVMESLESTDKKSVARAMGWKVKATGKFMRKCKKWGYIE